MPLYEYKCHSCGATFEVIQKVDEAPLKKCLKCGGILKKTISAPALQFKGNGWYVTDYANREPTDKEKSEDKKQKPAQADSKKKKKDTSASKD
jgi:putative FmdB family regulatory protein